MFQHSNLVSSSGVIVVRIGSIFIPSRTDDDIIYYQDANKLLVIDQRHRISMGRGYKPLDNVFDGNVDWW